VHIADGDTVNLLVGKETIKIRLDGIDAPESKQAFGTRSKEALAKLIAEKNVIVHKSGEDRYRRTLGTIYLGQTNVNQQLVSDGWAWHYKKYSQDKQLADLETKARGAKVGLWADPNPLSPWDFRARQKEKTQPQAETADAEAERPANTKYWLNTSSNVRHNPSCANFQNTKKGRFCTATEGKACGKCGG
ncbi:MAG: micrococcal nuclease, partial [Planctomycetaceae bacterium]|nr:micrococcal nuclease [Planctomycetaceae bacterium]